MNQEDANKLLTSFEDKLNTLVCEELAETDITGEQVDEYYGYYRNSPVAERLEEQREFLESLKSEPWEQEQVQRQQK